MNVNVSKSGNIITADDYEKGESILKEKYGNDYKIRNVSFKRKWFLVGPKYCEIEYINLMEFKAKAEATIPVSQKIEKKSNQENLELSHKMEDLDEKMEMLMKEMHFVLQKAERNSNDTLTNVEDVLVKNGVNREIAQELIKRAVEKLPKNKKESRNSLLFALKDVLDKLINTSEGYDLGSVKTIMLVGPTGVGKTTTLAKLASILYAQNRDVGMITLDTFRLGAVAQLKEYGNILNFPIEACTNIDELQSSLLKFMDKDCILIDTTGQNQKKVEVDDVLKEMVDLINPDQLSLVLSATTKTEDLYDCIDKFKILDANSVIITKMDETNTLGEILNIAYRYPKLKMAYFTNGQDVPEDIEAAKSEKIIKSIIDIS